MAMFLQAAHDRIAEAEREGWLGEIEGLVGTEDKLTQIDTTGGGPGPQVRRSC